MNSRRLDVRIHYTDALSVGGQQSGKTSGDVGLTGSASIGMNRNDLRHGLIFNGLQGNAMCWEPTGAPGHSTENPNSQPRSTAFASSDHVKYIRGTPLQPTLTAGSDTTKAL